MAAPQLRVWVRNIFPNLIEFATIILFAPGMIKRKGRRKKRREKRKKAFFISFKTEKKTEVTGPGLPDPFTSHYRRRMCHGRRAQKLHGKSHISIRKVWQIEYGVLTGQGFINSGPCQSCLAYILVQTHIVGSAMSLHSEQRVWRERAREHFHQVIKRCWIWRQGSRLENHSSGEHPTISSTVGPGNPQSQMTITVCFPVQWGPEPWSLGVGKVFMLTLPCRPGASEKGTSKLNHTPLQFSRKIGNHGPFLKAARPILQMHVTLFLNLSALR